ncbi:MAG: hypothetical protein WBB89_02525 [Candidatus Acidiferrum sp.]
MPSTKAYERHVDHMLREEPHFQFVRADYVAHKQIVCPIISGLVGLPRPVVLYFGQGSRVLEGIVRCSKLSDCPLTSFRQYVKVTTARVQHTCAGQFIDGVEHVLPFGRFVARRLK